MNASGSSDAMAGERRRAVSAEAVSAPAAPAAASNQRVSVIIPTWNEAERLPAAIAAARGDDVEILVVDGGSTDDTVAVARAHGARVVTSAAGRGRQLAAGAAAATGEFLVFLHADASLPAGYLAHVRATLGAAHTALGAFRLRIDGPGLGLRWIEWCVRIRSRWLQMPYGDQALFVRAPTYRALGGFRDLPAMEDFDFVRRARRHGAVVVVEPAVLASARAWQRHGMLRLTLLNALCAIACSLGVAPARVARWRVRQRLVAAPMPRPNGTDSSPPA